MQEHSGTDFTALIPELPQWNNGEGIDPESWIGCVGNYDLAAGYSLIFWPAFRRFEGYILRDGFCEGALLGFEKQDGDRQGIETVMNHIHIADIHCNQEANEAQLRYLGRVLKEIYTVKLRHDFPELSFEVFFNDEPNLDPIDYQVTFWQTSN